ncbi:DUF4251 domain-containing protein [Pedobacter sp. Du54]|uniref:DUF4251 domain-containing protein n=1 Tax=Pedobacter anseongensis TaxID=3133439 RepID=UPI0030A1FB4C
MKNLILILFTLISLSVYAQTDKATTKRIVEAKNFTFVASSALPMNSNEINTIFSKMPGANGGGGNINLVGDNYTVRVTSDSILVDLPYYGRAFTAPIARDDAGYKFTSTKFSYQPTAMKKGGWQIAINPQDSKDSVRMYFTISANGYASLTVSSINKQSISYNGYISEPKKELSK